MQRLIALGCLLIACAASAQNVRSAVSRNGNDANPCTVLLPCRSFGVAINVTNPGGEIVALDSAGYGPFSIDRPITVEGAPGVDASITVNGGSDGIGIAAPDASVVIRNIKLIAFGGSIGIAVGQSKNVYILNCLIRGFHDIGILGGTFTTENIAIEHTRVFDTVGAIEPYGIYLRGASGNPLHGLIHDCVVSGSRTGIFVEEFAFATITNSTISDGERGIFVDSFRNIGAPAEAVIESCNIVNFTYGVKVSTLPGNNISTAMVSKNDFVSDSSAVYVENNGSATTFGNNRFVDVFSNFSAPPATATLK
jgi:nitrous oxidase accessory protein NosD